MTLAPGVRFGRYQVTARLGAGGMGEVYRAVDSDLRREVALKILPPAFASEPRRMARFQREAEILASLNHSNIAILYGLENVDNVRAIAMELISGVDLSDRIAEGPVAVDRALRLAKQIAEALDAAHQAGVVHRDLKPSNIRVRTDGTIKVLDFGLAKALDADWEGAQDGSAASGVTATLQREVTTEAGMILGTVAYMSPEQARGEAVDTRTDIWAFGCVLFEMLAGRAPFARSTVSDSLAAILEREPDWTTLPAATPPAIRRLLGRCLAKDRQRRLRDIGDAVFDIEEALASPAGETPAIVVTRRRWPIAAATGVAAFLVGALGVSSSPWRAPRVTTGSMPFPTRFAITPPPNAVIDITRSALGVSRDGRTVAFAATIGRTQQIFLRELDAVDVVALPGTEGGFGPFFSPDGQWVGFFANQKLRKVFRGGGTSVPIADFVETAAIGSASASWDEQDSIFYSPELGKGIWRVPSSGGAGVAVTMPGTRETFHVWPQLLPGGRALLFSAIDDQPDPQVYVQVLETGERKPLLRGHGARYVPSGHVVFLQGGSLMAVPFDPASLQITGAPRGVVPDVTSPFRLRTIAPGLNRSFDVSPAGTLAFVSAGKPPVHELVWVDRAGREEPAGPSGGTYAIPRLSPDGKRIAVVVRGDDFHNVWVYDLDRRTWDRFTSGGNAEFPVWSTDGTRLAYNTDRSSGAIEWKRTDGSSAPEPIVAAGWGPTPQSSVARQVFPFSWSPEGWLSFVALRPAQDVYVTRPQSGVDPTPVLTSPFIEGAPLFSPDGKALAYISNETGRNEVYLRAFPGPGEKLTVSTGGGVELLWPTRGKDLFYRQGDTIMAVDVTTSPRLSVGTPRPIFTTRYEPSMALYANYSTIDGERFLVVKRIDQATASPPITVVTNWFEQLTPAAPSP